MYRAVTWYCVNSGVDLADAAAIEHACKDVDLQISTNPDDEFVRIGSTDITDEIREPSISASVSAVATTLGARAELVRRQQQIIADSGRRIVAEGRDITTVVAPDAEVRLLLTASEEARLRRRGLQLGGTQSDADLHEQVLARDAKDSTVVNFSEAADGVFTVDSSDLDFEQTVEAVLAVVRHAAH